MNFEWAKVKYLEQKEDLTEEEKEYLTWAYHIEEHLSGCDGDYE